MRLCALLLAALVGACAATPAVLTYTPPAIVRGAPHPSIGEVRVVDERGRPASDAGSVLGYDGKPFKRLVSANGVPADVERAMRDALAARGDFSPVGRTPRYDVVVTLRDLQSEDAADYLARADLRFALVERRTGRAVYTARVYAEDRGDNPLSLSNGVFGSPAALSRNGSDVLTRAIDRALDHDGFALALR